MARDLEGSKRRTVAVRILVASVRGMVVVLPVLILAQIYAAGAMLFGVTSSDVHRRLGETLILGVAALTILSAFTSETRRASGVLAATLTLLIFQVVLVAFRASAPALAAAHSVNAVAVLALSLLAAQRLGRRPP